MTDLSGSTIGGYQFLDKIGRGGMCDVYFCIQIVDGEAADAVVVKVPRNLMRPRSNADMKLLLSNEYEILTAIGPNDHVCGARELVQVGELRFLVLNVMYGLTAIDCMISTLKQGGRVSDKLISAICIGACKAANRAHFTAINDAFGIIHRDIGTKNVMVCLNGNAMLFDWGIADFPGNSDNPSDPNNPDSIIIRGTPSDMSPEQSLGRTLDKRSDIFQLGTMLYEMIVLEKAFGEGTVLGTPTYIRKGEYGPQLTNSRCATSVFLEVIKRCWQTDPNDRFQTAHALKHAIAKACPPASKQEVTNWLKSVSAT